MSDGLKDDIREIVDMHDQYPTEESKELFTNEVVKHLLGGNDIIVHELGVKGHRLVVNGEHGEWANANDFTVNGDFVALANPREGFPTVFRMIEIPAVSEESDYGYSSEINDDR